MAMAICSNNEMRKTAEQMRSLRNVWLRHMSIAYKLDLLVFNQNLMI